MHRKTIFPPFISWHIPPAAQRLLSVPARRNMRLSTGKMFLDFFRRADQAMSSGGLKLSFPLLILHGDKVSSLVSCAAINGSGLLRKRSLTRALLETRQSIEQSRNRTFLWGLLAFCGDRDSSPRWVEIVPEFGVFVKKPNDYYPTRSLALQWLARSIIVDDAPGSIELMMRLDRLSW